VRFPCSNHYWEKYAKQNGFAETHHKLEVYGRCANCAKK
jgi:Fe2+ or Zn2+ uptake regulation protein